ncbi:alcohol dehydrogenase catalytic domain-containing protein [Corynebacterium sp. TAE3-ERU2]|uniref:alcohol dehydrogenase catalytic domain-containing protein n=1 Tax=Corynebacterium sp. TAE3-ERU2 TaxID=2849497 RepID=UPI001C4797EA|nr:alcohol dehydrogenase catalytic domain-containing protein [Corynebacterium sp. TAE3-ERU2]MBV7303027.1 alcohol dehydrogenase catalytic domain-containing protein [Corynebacterium sp. TAE3-ERU2]
MASTRTIRGAILERSGDPRPYADSRPITVGELELTEPGPDEVLVKINAAGLCHSDLSVVNNNRPRPLPMLLGHESAGVIEALGPNVEEFEVGQHVVMTFLPRCGDCPGCATNGMIPCEKGSKTNNEGTLLAGTRHLTRGDETIQHHLGVSGFATHAVVSTKSIVPIGSDVPADIAAIFGCAILTGGGAILNEIKPSPDDTIAVVGLGGVGMAAIITAAAVGVKEIVGIDLQESKREKALELGATHAMTPTEAIESGKRFSATVEAAGHPAALKTAYDITKMGGLTVTVGLPHPEADLVINALKITAEARRIHGSYLGSAVPSKDIPRYEELWRAGKLNAKGLISSYIGLEDINKGMDALEDGVALRQIIMFD